MTSRPDPKNDWYDPLSSQGLEHVFAQVQVNRIPQLDVRNLLLKLHQSYQHLQTANYRIGYLEAQLDGLRQKVSLVEDMQSRIADLDHLVCANRDLENILAEAAEQAERAETLRQENAELQLLVIDRQQSNWWSELLPSFASTNQGPKANPELSYYDLIRKSLEQ